MNIYLVIIPGILIAEYLLNLIVELLNLGNKDVVLPGEFDGYYDPVRYKRSQQYLKDRTVFSLVYSGVFTFIIIVFMLKGGFNYVDRLARAFEAPGIITGLLFAGILMVLIHIFNLPFSAYQNFVIEAGYGFNRMTGKTFLSDKIKSFLLTLVIGGAAFAAVILFFQKAGNLAWIYCWAGITIYELFLIFIAPIVIMPLFNKFRPLPEGELKTEIERFADRENFRRRGLFVMDGSRRSVKTNAFFTGFGRLRRIVFYDTLINRHTVPELVSILAHEIGHYKKHHILKHLLSSIITTGLMFFILSFFLRSRQLFSAFGMEQMSLYAGLFFFAFLYSPMDFIFSVVNNVFSRKHEYEADAFAVKSYNNPEAMITALKKLTSDNLSNLRPHPLKVFLKYSHPPILDRIKAIRNLANIRGENAY